ncbi:KdsC family phosphatase [Dokdonia ponticola]|uniref:KdsC family phosphatase n=1 Tax=Dokdonia ponticola TaxID=2041041 RepID=A0ABV9I283_9FLAO
MMKNLPKLILTDIDGVWTDGGMYYDQQGNEWKKFNTSDSAGVLFAKKLNIPVGIITGENTKLVARRAEKLGVSILYQGISNKLKVGVELCEEYNISLDEIAYIGDDIGDINLLNAVGFSACPSNAPAYIKSQVDFITKLSGGKGAFREFVEYIIGEERLFQILQDYN